MSRLAKETRKAPFDAAAQMLDDAQRIEDVLGCSSGMKGKDLAASK
jgi:hypothetical protein